MLRNKFFFFFYNIFTLDQLKRIFPPVSYNVFIFVSLNYLWCSSGIYQHQILFWIVSVSDCIFEKFQITQFDTELILHITTCVLIYYILANLIMLLGTMHCQKTLKNLICWGTTDCHWGSALKETSLYFIYLLKVHISSFE